MQEYIAAIEAGGTKFNCAILNTQRQILAEERIATTTPDETLSKVIAFFSAQKKAGFDFKHLGLACFGPVDLNKASASFGSITATPKPHWSHTPITRLLEQDLDCTVSFDTDVNAAALAEHKWGAGQGSDVCIYVTVGTGLGVGVVINGKPLHGLIHPEVGHMLITPPEGIQGICPYHGNCIEGLASGKAMGQIWQQPAETLPDDHRAWDVQAQILALLCHNLMLTFSPHKIILGGGVMSKPDLITKVIAYTEKSLADYLCYPSGLSLKDVISPTGLGQHSGLFGALALCLED
jgi:fructokinase